MRIQVLGDDTINAQARTYAEYRLFAALTQLAGAEHIRHARAALRGMKDKHGCQRTSCTVTVAFDGAPAVRIRTAGDHPYAAINRAVERLRPMDTLELRDYTSGPNAMP